MSFTYVNGRLTHFRLVPGDSGRPIVFANSLGTDLRIWDDVIEHLPTNLTTLTYDKSGHGLSESGARTTDAFADDLAALMDASGLRDALVCGVSFGGMIAQSLAARRPDLVAGLVLCNTGARIGQPETWYERIGAVEAGGLGSIANGVLERWFSPRFHQREPALVAGYKLMLARTPAEGYVAACRAIADTDLTTATRALTCPTLCVAGSDDQATPPAVVEALAALIAGSETRCYKEVGHLPCIEAPEQLAIDIAQFIERLP